MNNVFDLFAMESDQKTGDWSFVGSFGSLFEGELRILEILDGGRVVAITKSPAKVCSLQCRHDTDRWRDDGGR